ncbi:MAG: ATP-binding protein [Acidobacteriota bacterium]
MDRMNGPARAGDSGPAMLDADRLLDRLLHSETIVYAIYDLAGRIVHANPALTVLTGRSESELMEMPESSLYRRVDDRAGWPSQVRAAPEGTWVSCERVLNRKDGSPLYLRGSAVLLGDSIHVVEVDVTEQRREEEALTEETGRFHANLLRMQIVHSIGSQVVSIRDIDALMESVVGMIRTTFGYRATSVWLLEGDRLVCKAGIGDDPDWKPKGLSLPVEKGVIGAAFRSGRSRLVPDVSKDKDFLFHPSMPNAKAELSVPLYGTSGPLGVLDIEAEHVAAFDEQDRLAMEALSDLLGVAIENARLYQELQSDNARLQQMDRLKSEFASMIGHDIKNPLSIIRGYAELIGQMPGIPAGLERTSGKIVSETEEISHLADQMLTLFRIDAADVSYSFESVDVSELLDKVTPLADDRHPMVLDLPPSLPRVRGDRRSLLQVMRNLATNAIKYSPAGGVITLRAVPEGDCLVRIEVQDQGVGISQEDTPRLFQKFQRIWNDATELVSGTGLGLYICRKIVEDHGGRIGAVSQPGVGSTFFVLLPRT